VGINAEHKGFKMRAIAAMDLDRGIGIKNQLPWNLPEDFKWFRQKTLEGGKLLMGRDTFRSVGVLPKRFTYVLTNHTTLNKMPPFGNYQYVDMEFVRKNLINDDNVWLCGGTKTYAQLLKDCSEVFITIVLNQYECDSYLPEFEGFFGNSEIIQETEKFWIVRYWK
jgi:dihydrofolate reductase